MSSPVAGTRFSWKRTALNATFQTAEAIGLMPVVRNTFAGAGVVLMFHEIQQDPAKQLMTGVSASFLESAIGWVKRSGWEIVSMDEAVRRLSGGRRESRFVVITFDDGYRDNVTVALPILEAHAAPCTIYVPTAAIERSLHAWWLALRTLIIEHDVVEIEAMGLRFDVPSLDAKIAAFTTVQNWVRQDLRRSAMLEPTLVSAGISMAAINDGSFVNGPELRVLARHPLVTIGAHTSSHPILATLDRETARSEMNDNRTYLEAALDRPVAHLAYPYGGPQACGPREAEIAEALGFHSAVTTRFQRLTQQSNRYLLPRLPITAQHTPTRFAAQMNGFLYQPASLSAATTDATT